MLLLYAETEGLRTMTSLLEKAVLDAGPDAVLYIRWR